MKKNEVDFLGSTFVYIHVKSPKLKIETKSGACQLIFGC